MSQNNDAVTSYIAVQNAHRLFGNDPVLQASEGAASWRNYAQELEARCQELEPEFAAKKVIADHVVAGIAGKGKKLKVLSAHVNRRHRNSGCTD